MKPVIQSSPITGCKKRNIKMGSKSAIKPKITEMNDFLNQIDLVEEVTMSQSYNVRRGLDQ